MKLSTLIVLLNPVLAISANLIARQGLCPEDNCFRAVWGTNRGADHPLTALRDCMNRLTTTVAIFPITTITVVARRTTTAVVACSTTPASSTTSSLTSSASSLPGFTFPSPTARSTSTNNAAVRFKPRQNEASSSSTTTIVGPIPTYAGDNCPSSALVYASICSCKGVTQNTLSKLSTTLTRTDTLTLTSTTTSTAYCSTSFTVTLSHSSSTVITTVTMTSNPDDTSTGTGTVSVSSTSSSSSSSITDTTTTPSTTLITTSSSLNSTSTASASPTPICSGLGTITCNGTCHDAKTDRLHCGSCGNSCAPGLDCVNGVCARQPCDSSCSFDRFCNPGNGTSSGCICATDASQHGICFDKNRYQCSNGNLTRCLQTEASQDPSDLGCPVGQVCIKDICTCDNTGIPDAAKLGICVSTAGCGDSGTTRLGPLVKISEQEKRRRLIGE
ncbi:hypothetical protein EKO04_001393 [Ascochyta lentis]|uniref:Antifreeze protein n=1 Tax=Ascochyta lentis TaxID=205686 RepID=A0A8H7JD34_9PLEO|nr:hypothetical protein EKO04_001393 [Ascochyta lentis]